MKIVKEYANALQISEEEALKKLETIAEEIAISCSDCDSVSIPGFGTFQSIKKEESISTDNEGRNVLNPPEISVEFKPSVVLRKSLS